MPARNRKGLSENTRMRIKTSMIANRLMDHVLGKCEMSNTQVTAALGLLRKTLPDLTMADIQSTIKVENSLAGLISGIDQQLMQGEGIH